MAQHEERPSSASGRPRQSTLGLTGPIFGLLAAVLASLFLRNR
jgi:hypothetical protein